jgi:hypothetical protein
MDSVLAQAYPGLQYVVQDGGSSDDTRTILADYTKYGVQVFLENDEGQADAINRGFARTSAPIMGWLNSDDLLLPGALAHVAEIFIAYPDVDVVYGNRLIVDENDGVIGSWVLPWHDANVLQIIDYVPQETMFWRRQAWERVGATINTQYDFAIDWDLILRFLDTDCRFYHSSAFLGAFRHHPAQKTKVASATIGRTEMAKLRTRSSIVSRVSALAAHALFLAAHRSKHRSVWASVAPDENKAPKASWS